MTSRRKNYERRDTFSININVDTDDKTLEWINNQRHLSKATLDILKQYANGELLHIDTVKQMIKADKTKEITDEETEIKNIEEEKGLDFKPTSVKKKLIDIPEE